ncbi:MAG: hypothetical protein AAGF12_06010 [Myxococcota bacterium]
MRKQSVAATSILLGFLSVGGCANGTPSEEPLLVGSGKLDGSNRPALFLCNIASEGSGFFDRDTLRCEMPEDSRLGVAIDVTGQGGRHVGSLRLVDGPGEATYPADAYPLTLRAYARTDSDAPIVGLETTQMRAELVIESPEGWETARGPALPFAVWAVEFDSQTNFAQLTFEDYSIAGLDGVRFEQRNEARDEVSISGVSVFLRGGERETLYVPVPPEIDALSGRYEEGEVDFSVGGSGYYVITADGVSQEAPEPLVSDADMVTCTFVAGDPQCRLVARNGVTVESAVVRNGDVEVSLPLDGAPAVLPEGIEEVMAEVQLSAGIEGIDLGRYGRLEGLIHFANAEGRMRLPFELLHLEVTIHGVQFAFFGATERHQIRFAEPIDGVFEAETDLSVTFADQTTDAWVAVTPGVNEVAGKLTVLEPGGAPTDVDAVLRSGAFVLSPAGLEVPSPLESGAEMARCWLTEEASLRCVRNNHVGIESVGLDMYLEARDRSIGRELHPGEQAIITLRESLLPVVLTLTGTARGSEPVVATARIESGRELSIDAPLSVVVQ